MGKPESKRRHANVAEFVEHSLEKPVFLVVFVTLILRAAEKFSGGAFTLRFLGPFYRPTLGAIGLGLGAGSESLAAVAGRSWRGWRREALEIETRQGLRKADRAALLKEARFNAGVSFAFMVVGIIASEYAGIAFLLDNAAGHVDLAAVVNDLVVTSVITGVVLFFGVFKEAKEQGRDAALLEGIEDGMNGAVLAAIERWRGGTYTDQDTGLILEHLPPHRRNRFARAVAKKNDGRTWTLPQLLRALGLAGDDTARKRLSNTLVKLARNPAHGLEKDAQNKWVIPHWLVMQEWGEAIALRTVQHQDGSSSDAPRTLGGSLGGLIPGGPALAPVALRSTSGQKKAPEFA